MVQQSHYYPAAQASDLGFWPLIDGFDALGLGDSGSKKRKNMSAMSIPRYNQLKKKVTEEKIELKTKEDSTKSTHKIEKTYLLRHR